MGLTYLVQHAEKEAAGGDPGLTARGRRQAAATAEHLAGLGITAVWSSPLLRARQTAQPIAEVTGWAMRIDERVRERLNWDGIRPLADFFDDWQKTTMDRTYQPVSGDSSFAAADRMRSFLMTLPPNETAAVVTHGGVTTDLLRTLIGDDAVPASLLAEGVPSCGLTILDGLDVVSIASVGHLP